MTDDADLRALLDQAVDSGGFDLDYDAAFDPGPHINGNGADPVDVYRISGWPTQPHKDIALRFVDIEEFVAVDEQGADALLGDSDNVLVPEDGDVMVYGDGGAGKTTLAVDLAFHLAAGDDWCGIRIPHPVTVGIVENEGPRALFRQKLRRKNEAWTGSQLAGRLHVLDQPWARFTFADEAHRAWLAAAAAALELDIVFLGPLTRLGMNDAGTLQETRDFSALLADVRAPGCPAARARAHPP